MTSYPKHAIFAHADALRKFERELEEIRIEIMSIQNLVEMDPRVRSLIARGKAEATIARVAASEQDFMARKLLTERRERKQRIHAKAKQIVRQHQSNKGRRPDLVYKTRMRKATDNV